MSRTSSAEGHTLSQAARLLGLSTARIQSYVRAGFLNPTLAPDGEIRLGFQDLVVLRAARELIEAKVPPRRVRSALTRLKEQLPGDRPLTGVQITATGRQVVARDGERRWNPESGQALFAFEVASRRDKVRPLRGDDETVAPTDAMAGQAAEDWYLLGCEIEASDPAEARAAYRHAVELDPAHFDAHVNLGRMLHAAGEPAAALGHYRQALAARPDDPTALFNLGVALEDLKRPSEALGAYEAVLAVAPDYADAHYNLAGLHERLGDAPAAVRHLTAYKKLTAS